MVSLVADAMRKAGVQKPVIVIGHGGDVIHDLVGDGADFVWQREQLGTGHAVLTAQEALAEHDGPVLISAGDTPLVDETVFQKLLEEFFLTGSKAVIATAILDDPSGYGRIVRSGGEVVRNVEDRDASCEEKEIREVNAAIYCVDAKALLSVLPELNNRNDQREYYLTDMIEVLTRRGERVTGLQFADDSILAGVNDRWQLALASSRLKRRILKSHATAGVTIVDPDSTIIYPDVEIGVDTVIEPFTILAGATRVGTRCRIGPNSRITDTTIGDDTKILCSMTDAATIGSEVKIGPFAHIRPKTVIEDGVRIGNFVELKNAHMQTASKANHLAYIGDASVGANSNLGAGTITCNYDGVDKYRTTIGSDAFIGSNSTLVAPVAIGNGAMVAAGSVITKDIPACAGAFGRARQETKEEWAAQWRIKKLSAKQSSDEA
jgi:bifunctional UDP-N-acetylglucosamine pyrophosphorylase/glucosamine-1-phosphate N-acetyltransferase